MKERPILFSGPMVRAILEGRKTQTRRTMRWQVCEPGIVQMSRPGYCEIVNEHGARIPGFHCPYGKPGDRLWVRESIELISEGSISVSAYCADGAITKADAWPWQRKKLPSIHCPRGLSRILLEITSVRVERLQDISDADCHSEGAIRCARPDEFSVHSCIGVDGYAYLSPLGAFFGLWTKINGRESWNANPWVWVIEFQRVQT